MSDSSIRIKPYDGSTDFAMWQAKMKVVLIKEKCWRAVTEDYKAGMSDDSKKEMDQVAHSEIMIRISDEVARQVIDCLTAKSIWDTLASLYHVKTLSSRISLLCRIFNFKMNVSASLDDNLDRFLRMTQDLERCDDKINDTHQAVILLNALPNQFDTFKDVIQFSRDLLTKTDS